MNIKSLENNNFLFLMFYTKLNNFKNYGAYSSLIFTFYFSLCKIYLLKTKFLD